MLSLNEESIKFVGRGHEPKTVLIEGNEDFSKGFPETDETKAFTASKGWPHRLKNKWGLKNTKMARKITFA